MKTASDLLRDADPLRHEPPLTDRERVRMKQAMLVASAGSSPRPFWPRRTVALLVTAVLLAVVGSLAGSRLWQESVVVQAQMRFEVRLAEDRPGDGLVETQIDGSDQVAYLHPEIVVTNGDIAQSSVVPGNGPAEFWISVEFTPAGAQKMRQATAEHVGRPVAILIDGEVVAAPRLRSPISISAVISGDFGRAEAETIVDGIRVQ